MCKEAGCHFAEDLNKEDRDKRQVLWPRIKQARAGGKVAYFWGPFAFIEGKNLFVLQVYSSDLFTDCSVTFSVCSL